MERIIRQTAARIRGRSERQEPARTVKQNLNPEQSTVKNADIRRKNKENIQCNKNPGNGESRLPGFLCISFIYSFPSKHESNHVPLPFMLKRREVEQVNYAGKVSLDKIFAKWYRNKWLLKKDETLLSETSNLYPIYLWALAH